MIFSNRIIRAFSKILHFLQFSLSCDYWIVSDKSLYAFLSMIKRSTFCADITFSRKISGQAVASGREMATQIDLI